VFHRVSPFPLSTRHKKSSGILHGFRIPNHNILGRFPNAPKVGCGKVQQTRKHLVQQGFQNSGFFGKKLKIKYHNILIFGCPTQHIVVHFFVMQIPAMTE
jgi:hypothetical protein